MGFAIAQTNGQTDSTQNATAAGDSSWTTYRSDDGRTGVTSADGPAPYPNGTWDDFFTGRPTAAPSVANGTAYLGVLTENEYYKAVGAVAAYNASDGALQWSRTGLGEPKGAPTVVGDTVYVATEAEVPQHHSDAEDGAGGLYALDAATGETVWKRNDTERWTAPAVHADDRVYAVRDPVNETNSTLVAVDPATGDTTWSVEADGLLGVANGTIVATHDGRIVAYDLANHEELWRVDQPPNFEDTKTAVSDDGVYGVSDVYESPLRAYAFSLADGETRWNVTVTNASTTSYAPAATDDAVFLTSEDEGAPDSLVRLDAGTGAEEWRYTPGEGGLSGAPTVGNDTVYVGANSAFPESNEPGEGYQGRGIGVYAVDADDGSQEWGYLTGTSYSDKLARAPSVVGDSLYLASNSKALYAQGANGALEVIEASTSAPSESETPSDGYYENDTQPTVSIEKTTEDPGDEFGDEKTVRLNASASVGQGEIDSIAWDVDDDGTYEHNATSITITLEQCEQRQVTAEATTDGGETASETVTIKNAA